MEEENYSRQMKKLLGIADDKKNVDPKLANRITLHDVYSSLMDDKAYTDSELEEEDYEKIYKIQNHQNNNIEQQNNNNTGQQNNNNNAGQQNNNNAEQQNNNNAEQQQNNNAGQQHALMEQSKPSMINKKRYKSDDQPDNGQGGNGKGGVSGLDNINNKQRKI